MRLPACILKKWCKEIVIRNHRIEMTFYYKRRNRTIKEFLESVIIWIDKKLFFNNQIYPKDFDIVINENLYKNQNLAEIDDYHIQAGDVIKLSAPNRTNLSSGRYKISLGFHGYPKKINFKMDIFSSK